MARTVLLIVLIIGIGIAGFGVYAASSSGYFIENFSPGHPRSSEIPLYEGDSSPDEIPVYQNDVRITPTLDDFKNIMSESYNIEDIFSKFGEPNNDIGSGIHIYVYELNDSTEIWIGYTDHIWYIQHVDSDGILIEELFVYDDF